MEAVFFSCSRPHSYSLRSLVARKPLQLQAKPAVKGKPNARQGTVPCLGEEPSPVLVHRSSQRDNHIIDFKQSPFGGCFLLHGERVRYAHKEERKKKNGGRDTRTRSASLKLSSLSSNNQKPEILQHLKRADSNSESARSFVLLQVFFFILQ